MNKMSQAEAGMTLVTMEGGQKWAFHLPITIFLNVIPEENLLNCSIDCNFNENHYLFCKKANIQIEDLADVMLEIKDLILKRLGKLNE